MINSPGAPKVGRKFCTADFVTFFGNENNFTVLVIFTSQSLKVLPFFFKAFATQSRIHWLHQFCENSGNQFKPLGRQVN